MYVFSALALVVGTGTILFGIYVLLQNQRSLKHRIFFALCASVGFWNFLGALAFSTSTESRFWFWFRPGSFFLILFVSLLFHFTLVLTESRHALWLATANYAASLAIHYANWTGFFAFKAVERLNGHWVFSANGVSPWFYLWILYSHGAWIASGLLILRWGRRSDARGIGFQARIVGWSLIVILAIGSFGDFLGSPLLGIPAISPILFAGWTATMALALFRYRFLGITKGTISRDMLQSMDTVVILLDQQNCVVMANRKAETIFGSPARALEGRPIGELLAPARIVETGLRRIASGQRKAFTFMAQVVELSEPVTLEATISLVRDGFADPLGTMIIGQEQRGAGDFLRKFHITGREWETIQLILAELPNREIAGHMGVTERTVKSHITHIHDKLGIDNKIGLFRMLQEYNLLPEKNRHQAPWRLLSQDFRRSSQTPGL